MRLQGIVSAAFLTSILIAGPYILAEEEKQAVNKAPDFTLTNYDGKTVKLSDLTGKIVVLEWFNYECPFVKYHYEKASTSQNIAAKYKDKNVVWLAINSTKHLETQKNKEYAEKFKIDFPILDDRTGTTGRAYGAERTPHIFIIDAKGNIAYRGAIDNAPLGKVADGEKVINYAEKALDELTEGKAVTTAETKPYGCTVKYAK
ncbi:MAG: redoxin domain-containing protein [Sedimentisphaerales bacterium]|nr:redoxin domain-containing protein [Sedimentisphaerales bacterium]